VSWRAADCQEVSLSFGLLLGELSPDIYLLTANDAGGWLKASAVDFRGKQPQFYVGINAATGTRLFGCSGNARPVPSCP